MSSAGRHANLLLSFTRREFKFRFAGSVLGVGWALLGPVLLLGIYSLVFGSFFSQQGLIAAATGATSYTAYVAIALWPWMMFADGMTRGMMAIQQNASLVKKVAFPHALLVISAVNAVYLQHAIGYIAVLVLLQAAGLVSIIPSGPLGAIPLLAILYVMTVGLALMLAALQTLLKDVEQGITPAVMMLYFLTPIMYPITLIPESYRSMLALNPLAVMVTRIRTVLLEGGGFILQDFVLAGMAALALIAGQALFSRLSPYFEDFL